MFSETVDTGNKPFSYDNALLLKVNRRNNHKHAARKVVLKTRGCGGMPGACG